MRYVGERDGRFLFELTAAEVGRLRDAEHMSDPPPLHVDADDVAGQRLVESMTHDAVLRAAGGSRRAKRGRKASPEPRKHDQHWVDFTRYCSAEQWSSYTAPDAASPVP